VHRPPPPRPLHRAAQPKISHPGRMTSNPLTGVPDPVGGEDSPGAPGLHRVSVVVDLFGRGRPQRTGAGGAEAGGAEAGGGDTDLVAAVREALPLDRLPAMADPAALEDSVALSSDGTTLDVVLLVQALTPDSAMRDGEDVVEEALRAAGLRLDDARPNQVTVAGAYTP